MQNQATNTYTTKLTAEKVTMINAVSVIIVIVVQDRLCCMEQNVGLQRFDIFNN